MPVGIRLTSVGRRFRGYLLECLLAVITLGVGWLVWSLFAFRNGQTPAKQIQGMRCVSLREHRAADWSTMVFRDLIAKPVIGILSWATLGIASFWLTWDNDNQELWDKVVRTVVVDDPHGALRPAPATD